MVDKFRNDFFEKIIKEEKEKEKELRFIQKRCFHIYKNINQEKSCIKCGHFLKPIKNIQFA